MRTKVRIDGGDDGQFVKFDSRESLNHLSRTRSYNDAFYSHFNKSAISMSLQPASPTPYDYFNAFHKFQSSTTTEYPPDPADIVWPWEKQHFSKGSDDYYGSSAMRKERLEISPAPPTIERWAGIGTADQHPHQHQHASPPPAEDSVETTNFLRRKALALVGHNKWEPESFWERKLDLYGPAADFVTNDNFKFPEFKFEPPVITTTSTTTTTPRPTTRTTTTTTPRPPPPSSSEKPAFVFSSTMSYQEWKDYVHAVTGRPVSSTTAGYSPERYSSTTVRTTQSPPRESEVSPQPLTITTKFREEEAVGNSGDSGKSKDKSESKVKVKVKGKKKSGESENKAGPGSLAHQVTVLNLEKEIRKLNIDAESRESLMQDIINKSKEIDEEEAEEERRRSKPSK